MLLGAWRSLHRWRTGQAVPLHDVPVALERPVCGGVLRALPHPVPLVVEVMEVERMGRGHEGSRTCKPSGIPAAPAASRRSLGRAHQGVTAPRRVHRYLRKSRPQGLDAAGKGRVNSANDRLGALPSAVFESARGRQLLCRVTCSNPTSTMSWFIGPSRRRARSVDAARTPISARGVRTVVSGGRLWSLPFRSLNPAMATHCGSATPMCNAANRPPCALLRHARSQVTVAASVRFSP